MPEELGVHCDGPKSQSVDLLQSGHAVILYLHGNAGTRYAVHSAKVLVIALKEPLGKWA